MATGYEAGHEACRGKVCVVCYQKATRLLSECASVVVKEHIIDHYDISNPDFPCGVCEGCNISLSKKRADPDFDIPHCVDDYDPQRKTGLRSLSTCQCKICKIAKLSGPAFLKHIRAHRKKRGRPSSKITPTPYKICSKCFSKVYQGGSHSTEVCQRSAQRIKVDNIIQLASPKTLQKAASRVSDQTSTTPTGRPHSASVTKKNLFSSADMCAMQQDLQLSNTQTKTLARNIRLATGSRSSIAKNFTSSLIANNHRLDPYFDVKTLLYRGKDKVTKREFNFEQLTVLCTDVSSLIEEVMKVRQRSIDDDTIIRIGLDGGGGFFEVCLSIFNLNDPYPRADTCLSKKFKESGVKKVFILAIAPGIPESYVNVKRIWLNLKLDSLKYKYTLATDLKLCNIILGMMSHSSCHPCCWCDVDKNDLVTKGKQRTLEGLMKLFWSYFESQASKEDAKLYGNVIQSPILNNTEEDTSYKGHPPPELHLLIGPVNTTYKGLENVWPESEKWLKAFNVKQTDYHGGSYAGNKSCRLLNNVERLKALSPNKTVDKFVLVFQKFNTVVSSCYGDQLSQGYAEDINSFKIAFLKLGINVTPKIHAIFHHVSEFCSLTGRGLAPWSEQTSESIHHDFSKTWEKFKVKHIDNPLYKEHLLKAVKMYNSQHL